MQTHNITVNEALQAYIDPLTPDEYAALERSLLAEGCRDALVLWGDVLVDGHNRHAICQKHGLPFQTVQNTRFTSLEDVHLWMIDQHLGRRSVSDFQRGVLALRKKDLVAERRSRALASAAEDSATAAADDTVGAPLQSRHDTPEPLHSREDIARAARLSSSQVVMIEKIQKQATPEVVAALKAGSISLNAAAAVASLPAEEQVAAATAGKDELKQAAKRVRESRRKPKTEEATTGLASDAASAPAADAASSSNLQALQQRVAELTAENQALRQQLAALQAGNENPF